MSFERPNAEQKKAYDFIRGRIESGKIAPTVREIAEYMGYSSPSSAQRRVDELERLGLLRKGGGRSRSVELVGAVDDAGDFGRAVSVPVLREISRREDLFDPDLVETRIPYLPESDFRTFRFAVRVPDDSMKNSGIMAGDVLIAREASTASDGDLVVCAFPEGIYVAELSVDGGVFRLRKRDGMSFGITVDADDSGIVGIAEFMISKLPRRTF